MKAKGDAEKLLRAIKVFDRAKARIHKVLQSDALETTKVQQINDVKCGQGFSTNSGFGTARSAGSWMVG